MKALSDNKEPFLDQPAAPPVRLADARPATPAPHLELAPESMAPARAPEPERLFALDAFRGLTVLLMLLVNNLALDTFTPTQLTHAPWNSGLHLADLVLPWFVFCVGVSVPFAAAAFRRKGLPSWRQDLRIVGRAATLVAVGCLISSSLAQRPVFEISVLQLIGLAYLLGALLYDLVLSRRLLLAGLLLIGYWAAIRFVPVPGVGAGSLEENRNFIQHLNDTYLGAFRGLPSVVPATALVLIGTAAGDWLRRRATGPLRRPAWLLLAGLGLAGLGLLWSLELPFSKVLWTPSYVLFSAGTGCLLLGLLHLLTDGVGWRAWAYPLYVFGANAITAYVAPILWRALILEVWQVPSSDGGTQSVQQWLLDHCVAWAGRVPGGWLYTGGYIFVWWIALWLLYRRRLFVRA